MSGRQGNTLEQLNVALEASQRIVLEAKGDDNLELGVMIDPVRVYSRDFDASHTAEGYELGWQSLPTAASSSLRRLFPRRVPAGFLNVVDATMVVMHSPRYSTPPFQALSAHFYTASPSPIFSSQAWSTSGFYQAQTASLAMYPALTDPYLPLATNAKKLEEAGVEEKAIPEEYICDLTCEVMDNPVKLPSGKVVEQEAILKHVRENRRLNMTTVESESFDPYSRASLNESDISVDTDLKEKIEAFVERKTAEFEAGLYA